MFARLPRRQPCLTSLASRLFAVASLSIALLSSVAAHADWQVTYSCSANSNPPTSTAGPVTIIGPNGNPWHQNYSGTYPNPYGGGSNSHNPPVGNTNGVSS